MQETPFPVTKRRASAGTSYTIPRRPAYTDTSQDEDNLYVHHDIMLPSFPLCLEWLDFRLGRKVGTEGSGNYIAVGTFDPEIEIWDLDTVDSMYPDAILGKQKKKSKVIFFYNLIIFFII